MMQKRMTGLSIGLLFLAGAVFVLHDVATEYFFYWRFWWYDIMMHFLGGAVVGGLAAWLVIRLMPHISTRRLLGIVLSAVIVVGVGWEVFEYIVGIYANEQSTIGDTTLDIIMDTVGAFCAYAAISGLVAQVNTHSS